MKIETKWACGNFLVSLAAEPDANQEVKLQECGLRFLGQRVSAVDKVLGAFTKDANGKAKRIPGWKRNDVPFSHALADKLRSVFEALEFSDESILPASVEITEYVPTTAEPKYKEETEIVSRHESKGDLEEWLKTTVGYSGDTHDEDGEYAQAMLASVKAYKIAALKAM